MSGGAATVDGDLVVGKQASAVGSFVSVGGTASLTVDGNAQIGDGAYGSIGMGPGGTVDIKGSLTFGAVGGATGGGSIEGGSLTVGDGGVGHALTINAGSGIKIEDTAGVGAQVTVHGDLVNNGELELGLHFATPAATLGVTGTLTNNASVYLSGNAVLDANVVNTSYFSVQNGAGSQNTMHGNIDNFGQVLVSSLGERPRVLDQTGNFTNESTGGLNVIGSSLTIHGSGVALDNAGAVTIREDVNGTTAPLSSVAITGGVTNRATGTISIRDSGVTVNGAVDNFGSITATSYNANGNTAVSHVTVNGTLANETAATLAVAGGSVITVNGQTTNNGTIFVTDATAHWNGAFTNNGAYISDPSTQTFTDLTIGTNGYLVGGAGDVFDITGNLISTSAQNTEWSTGQATIEFGNVSGGSTGHTFDLTGQDLGATLAGSPTISPGEPWRSTPATRSRSTARREALSTSECCPGSRLLRGRRSRTSSPMASTSTTTRRSTRTSTGNL